MKDNLDEFSKKLRIEINSRIIALLKEERVDSDAIDRLTSLLMDIKPSAPPKDEIANLENKVKELESEKNALEEKADNEKAIIDNLKEQKRLLESIREMKNERNHISSNSNVSEKVKRFGKEIGVYNGKTDESYEDL